MNILIEEILEHQRAVGEFMGAIEGITLNSLTPEKNEQLKTALDKIRKVTFTDDFWKAVIEYSRLKEKQNAA